LEKKSDSSRGGVGKPGRILGRPCKRKTNSEQDEREGGELSFDFKRVRFHKKGGQKRRGATEKKGVGCNGDNPGVEGSPTWGEGLNSATGKARGGEEKVPNKRTARLSLKTSEPTSS